MFSEADWPMLLRPPENDCEAMLLRDAALLSCSRSCAESDIER